MEQGVVEESAVASVDALLAETELWFDRLRFLLFRPEETSDLWKAAQMSKQLVCIAVHRPLSVVKLWW